MALILLAHTWAQALGGRVRALTVDHGLRAGSAGEAAQVGAWLAVRGIEHHVLAWEGAKPATAIQARARDARYRLLGAWVREAGVLHLLAAHQMDDQAETFLIRLERHSGLDGLAAMAPVTESEDFRLLRPLLGVPKERLRATLEAMGQPWLEDPSNRDPDFARTRIRGFLEASPADRASGARIASRVPGARIAGLAGGLAGLRGRLEAATAETLAQACRVHPAGFAVLDWDRLAAAPEEIRLRILARLACLLGPRVYAPRRERLWRAASQLERSGKTFTLGGCRFMPLRAGLLVCREMRAPPEPLAVGAGWTRWDGLFELLIGPGAGGARPPVRLARLGEAGWRQVAAAAPPLRDSPIPRPVRPTLPALFDADGVSAVPHLRYKRPNGSADGLGIAEIRFLPPAGLTDVAK